MYVIKVRPMWATKDSDCLYLRTVRKDRWKRMLWTVSILPLARTFGSEAAAKECIDSLHHRKRDAEVKPTFTIHKVKS